MPAAASVLNADLFAEVQVGVNQKCTKAQILTGGAGENITLKASSLSRAAIENFSSTAFLWLNDNNNMIMQTTGDVQVTGGATPSQLRIYANSNIDLLMTAAAATMRLGDVSPGRPNIIIGGAMGTIFMTYVPAVPANWALPVPGDVWLAIDRLVAAVVARTVGGPV